MNALNELAECLSRHEELCFNHRVKKQLNKAQRIIAELAKVRVSSFGDVRTAHIADAERAVMKCLEIAEEGAEG